MNIRAMILAGLLGVPLVAGPALAAETGNLSLVDAAKIGDREAMRSLLSNRTKQDVTGPEGTSAGRLLSRVRCAAAAGRCVREPRRRCGSSPWRGPGRAHLVRRRFGVCLPGTGGV